MARTRPLAIILAVALLGAPHAWSLQPGGPPEPQAAKTKAKTKTEKAKHLKGTHPGWRQTQCFECHDAAKFARRHEGQPARPAECGTCHGYNGAPHEDHAIPINACGSCHALVEHASRFEVPGECIKCHHHPASPRGQ